MRAIFQASRRGVTLVELMVAMLILTLVCTAWFEIIGIQSAKREADRREAVERLSGMMDAFLYVNRYATTLGKGQFRLRQQGSEVSFPSDDEVRPVFTDGSSSVGYRLSVVALSEMSDRTAFQGWKTTHKWLVGELYDRTGPVKDAGKPFCTLKTCLGY